MVFTRAADLNFATGVALGSHHDPSNRAILRSVLYFLAGLSDFMTDMTDIHYLITRSLTTGISVFPRVVWAMTSVIFDLTELPDEEYNFKEPTMWIVLGFNLARLIPILNLAMRLQWTWSHYPWMSWIPTSLSTRKPTHSERASTRLDWQFGWRERLTVSES